MEAKTYLKESEKMTDYREKARRIIGKCPYCDFEIGETWWINRRDSDGFASCQRCGAKMVPLFKESWVNGL